MNDVWYCPKNPGEHRVFECYVSLSATWLVDEENELIKERSSGVDEMSDYDCHHCGAVAHFGIPPSALEQLAEAADDAGIEQATGDSR